MSSFQDENKSYKIHYRVLIDLFDQLSITFECVK